MPKNEQSKQKEEDKETFAATAGSVEEKAVKPIKEVDLAEMLVKISAKEKAQTAAGAATIVAAPLDPPFVYKGLSADEQWEYEAQTAAGLEAQIAAGASYWESNWKKHVTKSEAVPNLNHKPLDPINPNVWAEVWEYKKKKAENSLAIITGETKNEIERFIKDRATWSLVDIVYEFAFNIVEGYRKTLCYYQASNNVLQQKVAELEAKLKDSVPKVKTNPVADGRRKFKDE